MRDFISDPATKDVLRASAKHAPVRRRFENRMLRQPIGRLSASENTCL